ncbi:MAG: FGGY-family carbohydrate kinase, partial [Planctomycetota bacterium]
RSAPLCVHLARAADLSQILIVGGGSANHLLNQLIADASGRVVETGPVECTAIGNALMQYAALENITDAAPLRAIVRASCEGSRFEPDPARHARMQGAAARVMR